MAFVGQEVQLRPWLSDGGSEHNAWPIGPLQARNDFMALSFNSDSRRAEKRLLEIPFLLRTGAKFAALAASPNSSPHIQSALFGRMAMQEALYLSSEGHLAQSCLSNFPSAAAARAADPPQPASPAVTSTLCPCTVRSAYRRTPRTPRDPTVWCWCHRTVFRASESR